MKKLILCLLLITTPAMASAPASLDITIDQFQQVTRDARDICPRVFKTGVNGSALIENESDSRGYAAAMKIVLQALCISYGEGMLDQG